MGSRKLEIRGLRRTRQGAIIVMVAASLLAVMIGAGVVVDVGFWYSKRGQLQAMADMAAMSALGGVDYEQAYNTQTERATSIVRQIEQLNELTSPFWTIDIQPNDPATPTKITTLTLRNDYEMPTFFWRVVGKLSIVVPVQAIAERNQFLAITPPCAFFAKEMIDYNGAGNEKIDSYNSNDGNYSNVNTYDGKLYDDVSAVGCTNGSARINGNVGLFGDLYLGGSLDAIGSSGFVYGNVRTGGTVAKAGNFEITEETQPNELVPNIVIPDATAPADIATNNDNGDINLAYVLTPSSGFRAGVGTVNFSVQGNKELHLAAGGTYYFAGITLGAQVPLVIDGLLNTLTTIYLEGDAVFNGGITINDAGATAPNFRIIGLGSGHNLDIGGGTRVVADIYAPDYDFDLYGGTYLQGTIWANSITIRGGAQFTYDEALGLKPVATDTIVDRIHIVR